MNGKSATRLELQVISDICFSVVECYSTEDFLLPMDVIYPLRCATVSDCKGRIRLLIRHNHCMALVDYKAEPLIKNIFDDSEMLKDKF